MSLVLVKPSLSLFFQISQSLSMLGMFSILAFDHFFSKGASCHNTSDPL
jgi:hypothetical protein